MAEAIKTIGTGLEWMNNPGSSRTFKKYVFPNIKDDELKNMAIAVDDAIYADTQTIEGVADLMEKAKAAGESTLEQICHVWLCRVTGQKLGAKAMTEQVDTELQALEQFGESAAVFTLYLLTNKFFAYANTLQLGKAKELTEPMYTLAASTGDGLLIVETQTAVARMYQIEGMVSEKVDEKKDAYNKVEEILDLATQSEDLKVEKPEVFAETHRDRVNNLVELLKLQEEGSEEVTALSARIEPLLQTTKELAAGLKDKTAKEAIEHSLESINAEYLAIMNWEEGKLLLDKLLVKATLLLDKLSPVNKFDDTMDALSLFINAAMVARSKEKSRERKLTKLESNDSRPDITTLQTEMSNFKVQKEKWLSLLKHYFDKSIAKYGNLEISELDDAANKLDLVKKMQEQVESIGIGNGATLEGLEDTINFINQGLGFDENTKIDTYWVSEAEVYLEKISADLTVIAEMMPDLHAYFPEVFGEAEDDESDEEDSEEEVPGVGDEV